VPLRLGRPAVVATLRPEISLVLLRLGRPTASTPADGAPGLSAFARSATARPRRSSKSGVGQTQGRRRRTSKRPVATCPLQDSARFLAGCAARWSSPGHRSPFAFLAHRWLRTG
jgi:hypothetical protein